MRSLRPSLATLFAVLALSGLAAAGAPSVARAGAPVCDLNANGTFRFLTEGLPVGSTNAEYVARLVTANADGPVTFSVDQLPPGVALDPA
ncbi:MAG TPA: hypothetical protein VHQ66_03855, partial [Myxococcota bacterium]|nr:hypothetical protein [Myxococcota bacterium]